MTSRISSRVTGWMMPFLVMMRGGIISVPAEAADEGKSE